MLIRESFGWQLQHDNKLDRVEREVGGNRRQKIVGLFINDRQQHCQHEQARSSRGIFKSFIGARFAMVLLSRG